MPLEIPERQAVQILMDLAATYPTIAPQNFARTVLGAHSEQAKRLADLASHGTLPDETQPETIQVNCQIDGQTQTVTLQSGKLPITSYEELVAFYNIDTARWQPDRQVFNFWGNEANPNFQVKASFKEIAYKGLEEADRQATRDWFAALAPTWEPRYYATPRHENLLEIVISDLHADKLTASGTTLDQHLGRVAQAVDEIVARADGDGFGRIALVFLGDTFDHEGNGATTGGTVQATQEDPRRSYLKIRDWMGAMARSLAHAAPVDLYVLSGNHDRERAFYAVDSLAGLFQNHEAVTVHTDTRRQAIDWGVNLIGLWHGDKQRNEDIAMTLLREFPSHGKKVLEVHLGHIHTRREDEVHGVLLRRFRTPTPDNDWATDKLFNHNAKSVTGILWNKDQGEIAAYPYTFVGDAWTN